MAIGRPVRSGASEPASKQDDTPFVKPIRGQLQEPVANSAFRIPPPKQGFCSYPAGIQPLDFLEDLLTFAPQINRKA